MYLSDITSKSRVVAIFVIVALKTIISYQMFSLSQHEMHMIHYLSPSNRKPKHFTFLILLFRVEIPDYYNHHKERRDSHREIL